jgi:carboxylesterase
MTATPWEIRPLAEHIAKMNVSVLAPLLAGHGTSPAELNEASWEDWYAVANNSLAELRKKTRTVYVGGVSTGADLALMLAAEHEVNGVIVIAPPMELQDKRAAYAKYYHYVLPYVESTLVGPEVGHYYPYHSGKAVAQLVELFGITQKYLPLIHEPVLILQSIDDKTVQPSSASQVFYSISSKDKELLIYGNASHVLVQETDAPSVIFDSVTEWLKKQH